MDYVKLGRTGLEVSRICLGCMSYGVPDRGTHAWTLDEDASRPFIKQALELGINFFDTANVYSDGTSEEIVGRAPAGLRAARRGRDRDQGLLPDAARARTAPGCRARRSCPRSTPACAGSAPTTSTSTRSTAGTTDTPIEETLEALHDVVKAGKARYIGASSMYAWQFAKALHVAERHGWTRFVSDAEPLQPALPRGGAGDAAAVRAEGHRRDPLEPAGARPADPRLGRAARDRERDRRVRQDALRRDRATPTAPSSTRVGEVAEARGVPRAQVALAWLLQQPGITAPIIGATRDGTSTTRSRRWRCG